MKGVWVDSCLFVCLFHKGLGTNTLEVRFYYNKSKKNGMSSQQIGRSSFGSLSSPPFSENAEEATLFKLLNFLRRLRGCPSLKLPNTAFVLGVSTDFWGRLQYVFGVSTVFLVCYYGISKFLDVNVCL